MAKFAAFLAASSIVDGATTVGYPACMIPCINYCSVVWIPAGGPVGGAGCVGFCGASCTCFTQDTSMDTTAGPTSIGDLKAGDSVLTLGDDGEDKYTKVVDVTYIPAYFRFIKMQLEDERGSLTVTPNHLMLLCSTEDTGNSTSSMKDASEVRPTDGLLLSAGCVRVQAVEEIHEFGKHSLTTESCTVYANGVLTSTSCENAQMIKKFEDFRDVSQVYRPEFFEEFFNEHHRLQNMTV